MTSSIIPSSGTTTEDTDMLSVSSKDNFTTEKDPSSNTDIPSTSSKETIEKGSFKDTDMIVPIGEDNNSAESKQKPKFCISYYMWVPLYHSPDAVRTLLIKCHPRLTKHITSAFIKSCERDILKFSVLRTVWLKGMIYRIPKGDVLWNSDATNTRPITLLEVFKKLFLRIITARLSNILNTNSVLKGNNFSVLKETSTDDPIYILNSVIKHDREQKQRTIHIFPRHTEGI